VRPAAVAMATAVAQKGQMNDILRRHEPDIYALLRIVTGFLFLWHGTEKIFGFPEAPPAGAPAFILWVAGPIELVCGFLVMIGLLTRPAAFLASGLMAFAYWLAHGTRALADPQPGRAGGALLLRRSLHRRARPGAVERGRRRDLSHAINRQEAVSVFQCLFEGDR